MSLHLVFATEQQKLCHLLNPTIADQCFELCSRTKDRSRLDQGSVDLADFHIYYSIFHADHRGAISFSKMTTNYRTFRITHFRVDIFEGC